MKAGEADEWMPLYRRPGPVTRIATAASALPARALLGLWRGLRRLWLARARRARSVRY